jgi:heparan-alpha-glucosaminide N-acetyltransferase
MNKYSETDVQDVPVATGQKKSSHPKRLASIDVLRALTMFFMVFVNDLWTDSQVPTWLEHAPGNADAMGFSDVIFPAFLFIVGLSIPLSQRSRLAAGESKAVIFKHIVFRSFALILMGFFHVNSETYSNEALLPKPVWVIIVTTAFFLIWLDYPKGKEKLKLSLQGLGIVLLALMAAVYKGDGENGTIWMTKQWWGILGLIGWAYLGCASIFLLTGERMGWLVVAFLFFLGFNASIKLQWPEFVQSIRNVTSMVMGGSGSNASIIMTGAIISVLYNKWSEKPNRFFMALFSIAALLFVFGFATRPLWEISKIRATPSWTTICSAITILGFAALIYMVDKKGKRAWFDIIKPAGTSTLTCYLLPYFYYAIFISIIGLRLPIFLRTGGIGIVKSLLFALLIVLLTGLLEKRRLRLKL